jgi:integral membrane sensor domain MASE1
VFQLAVVFAAYVLGGRLGLSIPFTSGNVSPIWPPAGIALAAVLLVGYRIWPAVAAGAFLVNVLTPISAGAAIALAAGNTTGAIAGAWLLWRLPGFRSSLNRLDDVLRLILLAAPAGAALSATIGVAVLFTTHVDPWLRFWPAWLVWWLGDMTGMLIVAPLVLTLGNQRRFPQARRIPEIAALSLQNAIMLQAFIAVIAVSGVTLAAVIAERTLLIRRQAQREGLEQGERRYRECIPLTISRALI